jgi:hypothetical protein
LRGERPTSTVAFDGAVSHLDYSGSHAGESHVVSDHNGTDSVFDGEGPEEAEYLATVLLVEVAGWFVGEDETGLVGQRPSEGDPLLLPTAEPRRAMVVAIRTDANAIQKRTGAALGLGAPTTSELHGGHHVFEGGKVGQQITRLKDETDVAKTEVGEVAKAALAILALNQDAPGSWRLETTKDAEQSGLAAAGGASNRGDLACVEVDGDASESDDGAVGRFELFAEVAGLD